MSQYINKSIVEKREEIIATWEESKWLVLSSMYLFPSILLNCYKRFYFLFFILSVNTFASILFWQNATYSYRRTFDILWSKFSFAYYFYLSVIYLENSVAYIWIPNTGFIIYFYNKSNSCYENNEKIWLNYHMIFHFLVGVQSFIISMYIPELSHIEME